MTRLASLGAILFASAALAQSPVEWKPKPISVHPASTIEPTTTPVVLLEGTTVPACPTVCDVPCPDPARPGLLSRRTTESKTVCCDPPPALDSVLTRTLPVVPCQPSVCTESCGSCREHTPRSPVFHEWKNRTDWTPPRQADPPCPTKCTGAGSDPCRTAATGSCWQKVKAWLHYRTCPGERMPCVLPSPYQPSLFAYVKCQEVSCGAGCASGCGTGCANGGRPAGALTGRIAGLANGRGTGSAECTTCGPSTNRNGVAGLWSSVVGRMGLGGRDCTDDGSRRISQIGRHHHMVRDCTGAAEVAGTQLTPGFRFAGAEQIRLYGNSPNYPTAMPHWPQGSLGSEKPATEAPKLESPKPITDKPKVEEKPAESKKSGGSPTASPASPTGLSVNRPFTRQ